MSDDPIDPGDVVPPGTAATGEAVWPGCSLSGEEDDAGYVHGAGTGKIIEGMGGG